MLSKSMLCSRKSFLIVLRSYKVQISSFHILQPLPVGRYQLSRNVRIPIVSRISSRFESSQVISEKDQILRIPNESKSAENTAFVSTPGDNSTNDGLSEVSSVGDALPNISIVEEIIPLNKLGEPTLQSMGLGSYYTPVGWVQNALEFMHVTFDLPWWGSIAVCVVIARVLMFPLVIKNQRNSTKLHNVMPQMQEIQMRMETARTYGNHPEMMKAGHELAIFMRDNNVQPLRSMVLPLLQAPIFISFFMGLRKMAYHPVESMKEGGMLWFTDLTVLDQLYLLPLITCTTLWITLEIGADFTKIPSASVMSRYMPYVLRVIPIIVFPFIMNFPSAICVYWATTNFVSLGQVLFLRIPAVRDYFKINSRVTHDPASSPVKKKGVVKDIKNVFANMKIAKEIEERERLDEMSFRRAGRVPPAKTFKYNPVASPPVSAKSR